MFLSILANCFIAFALLCFSAPRVFNHANRARPLFLDTCRFTALHCIIRRLRRPIERSSSSVEPPPWSFTMNLGSFSAKIGWVITSRYRTLEMWRLPMPLIFTLRRYLVIVSNQATGENSSYLICISNKYEFAISLYVEEETLGAHPWSPLWCLCRVSHWWTSSGATAHVHDTPHDTYNTQNSQQDGFSRERFIRLGCSFVIRRR